MKNRGPILLGLFVIALLAAPNAHGQIQQAPIADCTQDQACLTLKDQASERSKSGDLTEALRLYKLAYEVRPDPRLLFNIARLLHKQGQAAEAAPYYQRFLDASIQDEDQRQKAQEYLAQIQTSTAVSAPTQTISPPLSPLNRGDSPTAGKPVYKKWWFWTILGGATVGVVLGASLGAYATPPRWPDTVPVIPSSR